MVKIEDRRYIVVDNIESFVSFLPKTEPDFEAASLRDGIKQILELHGEDFIKTRLRKLLNG